MLDPTCIYEDKTVADFEPVQLGVGSSFGELALIYNQTRTTSIQAHTDCHFAVLEKEDYALALQGDDAAVLDHTIRMLQ